MNPLVSVFSSFKSPPFDKPLSDVLTEIRTGKFERQITRLRALYVTDPDLYQRRKKSLPSFIVSGTARSRTQPGQHSNLIQVDLDKLGAELEATRVSVKHDPHVAFGFLSPSGDGLKLGVAIDGERHAESFDTVAVYFHARYGLVIDPSCKDRLRLCFVSFDPELWGNVDATPLLPDNEQALQHPGAPPIRLNTDSCIATSLPACIPASLHNGADAIFANITARAEAERQLLGRHPHLARLYTDFIESRFQAEAHARNEFITKSVPFLYRAVSVSYVLELVAHFYDCNRALFNDSREQHLKEAEAMLKAVMETYTSELSATERKIFEALPGRERDAFRVCRDLATLPTPEREPMTFFLSFNHLGDRLGIHPAQAQRIMRQFASYGLVKLLKRGTRRALGVRGEAGSYQWLLSRTAEGTDKP